MTILLVILASIIFTFLLYLAVNYKRVDVIHKQEYYVYGVGFAYNRMNDCASIFSFRFFNYKLIIKVWDEIRDLPF